MNVPNEVRSYRIVCAVSKNHKAFAHSQFEKIEFIATCNLSDYTLIEKTICPIIGEEYTRHSIDLFSLLQNTHPELIEFANKRLEFYDKTGIVDPVFDGKHEFIEFDHTAYSLAGPYVLNNREGAHVSIYKIKHNESIIERLISPLSIADAYSFCLPNHCQPTTWHTLTKDEKLEYIKSLSRDDVATTYSNLLKWEGDSETISRKIGEYAVYISGNDDCSYTKYVKSQLDATMELEYLRKRQPLNMVTDIKNRGYFFTN